mgnify:CR=1 FL=1
MGHRESLDSKKLRAYVCDFPTARMKSHPGVVALPHLGASTQEAEDNCAVMVVDQVRDYEFRVRFDKETLSDLIMDEQPPVGRGAGPGRLAGLQPSDLAGQLDAAALDLFAQSMPDSIDADLEELQPAFEKLLNLNGA